MREEERKCNREIWTVKNTIGLTLLSKNKSTSDACANNVKKKASLSTVPIGI